MIFRSRERVFCLKMSISYRGDSLRAMYRRNARSLSEMRCFLPSHGQRERPAQCSKSLGSEKLQQECKTRPARCRSFRELSQGVFWALFLLTIQFLQNLYKMLNRRTLLTRMRTEHHGKVLLTIKSCPGKFTGVVI